MTDCRPYVLKTVAFKFNGANLSLDLSHALFSSNDIDAGSKLLLKNIAKQLKDSPINSILDIGSGTGVLGIACAKAYQAGRLVLRDRDALASAFSAYNAARNKLRHVETETALFLDGLDDQDFDLVLCNVPAKAGPPVLDSFLRRLASCLKPEGRAGIVVVNTIAAAAKASLAAAGVEVVHSEEGRGHSVYLFARGDFQEPEPTSSVHVCQRTAEGQTSLAGKRYSFQGYYGLPEFDTPAYGTSLLAEVLAAGWPVDQPRTALLLEPGCGRLACWLRVRSPRLEIDLCSRDALAIQASQANLCLNGQAAEPPASWHFLEDCDRPAHYGLLLAMPIQIPGYDQTVEFWDQAGRVLRPGGILALVAPSTYFDRLDRRRPRGFTKLREKKQKGQVAALWRYDGD